MRFPARLRVFAHSGEHRYRLYSPNIQARPDELSPTKLTNLALTVYDIVHFFGTREAISLEDWVRVFYREMVDGKLTGRITGNPTAWKRGFERLKRKLAVAGVPHKRAAFLDDTMSTTGLYFEKEAEDWIMKVLGDPLVMQKRLILGALLLCSAVTAQESRKVAHLAFVVDNSGSMKGTSYDKALSGFLDIAAQATDHLKMNVYTFNDAGLVEHPEGWVKLPDKHAIDKASAWLSKRRPGATGTRVIPALEKALSINADPLVVILISDGEFYFERDKQIHAAVEQAQKKRKHQATICTMTPAKPTRLMLDLAKKWNGEHRLIKEKK